MNYALTSIGTALDIEISMNIKPKTKTKKEEGKMKAINREKGKVKERITVANAVIYGLVILSVVSLGPWIVFLLKS